MKKVYMVYVTDIWHSYKSRNTIGIGTDQTEAINICIQKAKAIGDKISQEQIDNLTRINQTQGYNGGVEFVIESFQVNKLL